MDLSNKKCIPCEVGGDPMAAEEIQLYSKDRPLWKVVENKKITRNLKFKDFKETMAFVNKVAGIAESEGHHPDIEISYNKVNLTLTTHAVGGLTANDFIMAAKLDLI